MNRSVSVEYTIEISDSCFDLRFVAGDGFYECDEVFLSIREIVISFKKPSKNTSYKLSCKNLCIPVFDKDDGTKTDYENLAIFQIARGNGPRQMVLHINSPEYRIPINGRRIEFEIKTIFDSDDNEFYKIYPNRVFLRFAVRRRNV